MYSKEIAREREIAILKQLAEKLDSAEADHKSKMLAAALQQTIREQRTLRYQAIFDDAEGRN